MSIRLHAGVIALGGAFLLAGLSQTVHAQASESAAQVVRVPMADPDCPPLLRDEVAKRDNWVRPVSAQLSRQYGVPPGADPAVMDVPWYVDAFYMPELSWESVTVGRGPGRSSYYDFETEAWEQPPLDAQRWDCYLPVQVRVNTIARQGAGAGVIVLRRDDLCATFFNSKIRSCNLFIGNKRYNLKKKAVRESLRCRNVSWVPNGTSPVQIVSRQQPSTADPEARTFGDEWRADEGLKDKYVWAGDYRRDWCIPVPSKPGKYPMTVIVSAFKQTLEGSGDRSWRCHWIGNNFYCGNYRDEDWDVDESYQYSYGVIVKADSVQVTKSRR